MSETRPRSLAGIEVRGRLSVWSPATPARPRQLHLLVTTRHGGVSQEPWDSLNLSPSTGDERDDVEANRQRLRDDTGMPPARWLHQVHGNRLVDAAALESIPGGTLQADGIWTQESDVALVIGIADCVPVFLWDRAATRFAVVHAGWRGTTQQIVRRAIDTLRAAGSRPEDLRLALGPCIGPCCYQVGSEVIAQLPAAAIRPGSGGTYADLRAANRIQAVDAGLSPAHIDSDPPCTACHPHWFFSHRRHGPTTGRMWAVAWRQGSVA